MQFKTIYFDMDETLYPVGAPIVNVFGDRMDRFIDEYFDAHPHLEKPCRTRLFLDHGTTAKGLAVEYGVDIYDFMHYVNEFELDGCLEEDPAVREMILRIPLPRYVLTNGDRFHAVRVLRKLNLLDCFDAIIDSIDTYPNVKPHASAYEFALKIARCHNPAECIFIDDKHDNVTAAHELGLFAIQVGSKQRSPVADAYLDRLTDLPKLGLYRELEHSSILV